METMHEKANARIRVHVGLLDSLMNLAGELVLGRNQLVQAIASNDKRLLDSTSQRIDLVTSELQEQIMCRRMHPIGTLFDQFPELVRELAINSQKKVKLSLAGKTVDLDKSIIEAVEQPLLALEDSIVIDQLSIKDHYQVICFKIHGREIGVLAPPHRCS